MNFKGFTFALGTVLTGVILSGCDTTAPEATDVSGDFQVTQVAVNGKQVTCITWADYKKGGLSCDWANAK